tara:strand:+ start:386 stop:601 length:216 start_codon:yes stop_codon:yes gene_type:complete
MNITKRQKQKLDITNRLMNNIRDIKGTQLFGTIICPICNSPLVWKNNRLTGKAYRISVTCTKDNCIGGYGQ